jgi:hypothetical protein
MVGPLRTEKPEARAVELDRSRIALDMKENASARETERLRSVNTHKIVGRMESLVDIACK